MPTLNIPQSRFLCAHTMAMWQRQADRYGCSYGVYLCPRSKSPLIEYLQPDKDYIRTITPSVHTHE